MGRPNGFFGRAGRAAWGALLVLLATGTPGAAETRVAPPPPGSGEIHFALLSPAGDEALRPAAAGLVAWLHEALTVAGLPPRRSSSSIADPIERARVAAETTGASHVFELRLRGEETGARVRMVVRDADGALVAASSETAPLAELGQAGAAALTTVLERLGHAPPAPLLSPATLTDLAALGNAELALGRGSLLEAWDAVGERGGAAAKAIRARIEAAANAPDAGVAERARLASAHGRATQGWLQLREALRESDDVELLVAAADVARARGDFERALRFYERAQQQVPAHASASVGRARALQEMGRDAEAQQAWREAMSRRSHDPAIHEALASLPNVPAEERSALLLRAADLHAAGLEVDQALALYDRIAQEGGAEAGAALRRRGELQARLGRSDQALATLASAQQREGEEHADTWAAIGRAREAAGDAAGAAQAWRQALALGHDEASARAGLGRALTASGDAAAARPELERAAALAPEDAANRRLLALNQRLSGDPEAALATLASTRPVGEAQQIDALRVAAEIHAERGELEQARAKLEQAVALEPAEPALREALAGLYRAGGDDSRAAQELALVERLGARQLAPSGAIDAVDAVTEAQSESAAPAGQGDRSFDLLLASFPAVSPTDGTPLARVGFLGVSPVIGTRARVMRWLRPRVLDLGAVEARLVGALERHYGGVEVVDPASELDVAVGAMERFTTDRDPIALVNGVLDMDASFVARLRPAVAEGDGSQGFTLEARLFGGRRNAEVFILANEMSVTDAGELVAWNPRALVPLVLALLGIGRLLGRGWGTLVVKLDYDKQGTRGFFDIVISRRSVRLKLERGKPGQKRRLNLSRFRRSMVGHETRFRFLPARTLHVAVQGLLQDATTKEVVGTYLEERSVEVLRGASVECGFDFRPTDAPIEVHVHRPEGAAPERVRVGLRGRPESFHYVRGGETALRAENGSWVVALVCDDRVVERSVEIRDFHGVRIDLSVEDEAPLFSACPDAVEPYVHGDLQSVADFVEARGGVESANLLRAEYFRQHGETAKAAQHLRAAGRLQDAAELAAVGDDTAQSAELYAEAGDFAKAAEAYREAGDFLRAGEAYESAYDYAGAAECFREAGDVARVMDLLERSGNYLDAGRTAAEVGDADRAIRNLQQVDQRDTEYGDACRVLSDLFAEREEWELATSNLERVVERAGADDAPLELLARHAELLERAGRNAEALATLEKIRLRDFSYDGVGERIDTLRVVVASETSPMGDATRVTAPAEAEAGSDRYEIVREVGRGGMGVVFEARDTKLGRVVALKRLPENLRENPTAVRLFLREARAAAALSHANIVTLYDADEADGNYFITMEFLDGLPLDAILRKRSRLTARDTVRMGLQVAVGLQYAHERRIVHRDIKTSNIFFTRERVVKIMDFGLAKMLEEVRRAATVIAGTPYYMAPEQAAGDEVDHRADLYAFGVTLFELITGRVPFAKGDVTYHHRHTPAPDPRSFVEGIPDPLAELILSLMAKSPDERPPTTRDVVVALKTIHKSLRSS